MKTNEKSDSKDVNREREYLSCRRYNHDVNKYIKRHLSSK